MCSDADKRLDVYSFGPSASHDEVCNRFLGFLLSVEREVLHKGKMMSGLRKRSMFYRSSRKHGVINVQCRIFRSSSSHNGARP